LENFKANFDNKVRKHDLPIDIEHHSDEGAVGWIKEIFIQGQSLFAIVEWTEEGIELVRSKKYRFFSPEFADIYEDPASGVKFDDVLIGGGITNRPFFQELEEIVLNESTVDVYKKFSNEKGGEIKMTKEELMAKLKENPDYKPENGVEVSAELMEEAKKALADEAKANTEDKEGGEDKGNETKQTNEKGVKSVTMSENQFKAMEKAAQEGIKAMNEIRRMHIEKEVNDFVFSESNKDGVLLPKSADMVRNFIFSLNDSQKAKFTEILKSLPKINVFGERGADTHEETQVFEDVYSELDVRAKKLMSEKPEVYKTYREAAYAVEKQMLAENKKFE
jgi:phage I-like protein